MKNAVLAKRYAEAIYAIAKSENNIESVYKILDYLLELFEGNQDVKNILLHPLITKKEKKEFIQKILSEINTSALNIIDYIIDKDRILIIQNITSEYLKLYYEENNNVEVLATFAHEITEEQKNTLIEKLSKKLKKQIILTVSVDEKLIGGGVIKINDVIIDGSIKHQIEDMKHTF